MGPWASGGVSRRAISSSPPPSAGGGVRRSAGITRIRSKY